MKERHQADSLPEVAVSAEPPFAIELMVYEEDTWRVLSAGNHIRDIREPLSELQEKVLEQQAHRLGELIVKGSRAFAILYDLDRPVPFCDEAVTEVLTALAGHVQATGLSSIGMQPLGHVHGPLSRQASVRRIEDSGWPGSLNRIWIPSG